MTEVNQPRIIQIKREDYELMRLDVSKRSPEEACGLLAGQLEGELYLARSVIPTTNLYHSNTSYRIDPAEQINAFNLIESQGLELVGIYHSHPDGPDSPSPTDIAQAFYPEAAYLIWFRKDGKWTCNAYAIGKISVDRVSIQLIEDKV